MESGSISMPHIKIDSIASGAQQFTKTMLFHVIKFVFGKMMHFVDNVVTLLSDDWEMIGRGVN